MRRRPGISSLQTAAVASLQNFICVFPCRFVTLPHPLPLQNPLSLPVPLLKPLKPSFPTLIVDLVGRGRSTGMDVFRWNGHLGTGDFPGMSCYNTLICELLKESRLEEVYDLLIEVNERNIVPDSYTRNATIGFFCKAGMGTFFPH